MSRIEHYKKEKQRENLTRFLSLLEKHGKLTFPDLAKKLGVSRVTLSSYIKILMSQKKIVQYKDEKDLRVEWYAIRPESARIVVSQLRQYEAIKFIETLIEPIHAYKASKDGTIAVSAFASIPQKNQEAVKTLMETVAHFTSLYDKIVPKLSEGEKVALVVMMSGKKKGD
jgi:DNA-binding MarR family transcriptional regulator